MEIPKWLNPFELAYELGRSAGEKWANSPSAEDPTLSNAAIIALGIARDVKQGRPLFKPYRFNPPKNAVRIGMVEAASALLEEKIRGLDEDRLVELFASPTFSTEGKVV